MTLLHALEKHIAGAAAIIQDVRPVSYEIPIWEEKGESVLCAFGLSAPLYNQARPWLDDAEDRRLVFVEDRGDALAQLLLEDDAILLLNDLRVKIYFIQTPLQIPSIARQIAWSAVFLKINLLNVSKSSSFDYLEGEVASCHRAAGMLLSDAADWGCKTVQNAKLNTKKTFRSALGMKNRFKDIPAILVGAGPTLEKNRHLLSDFSSRALIFSSGSACPHLFSVPHLTAGIDPAAPAPIQDTPYCIQPRAYPSSHTSSPLLIAPDSHFPFLSWLVQEESLFDGGWTVGTFMMALAQDWGCNPVICVGMDYAYADAKKYADGTDVPVDDLIQTVDREGRTVWTQQDWLLAKQWTEEFARKHSEISIINATEGGLGFGSPIIEQKLSDIHLEEIPHLHEKIKAMIHEVPLIETSSRWQQWKESLIRSLAFCKQELDGTETPLRDEIIYSILLQPLWQIWRSVFARRLDLDPHKIAFEQKMKLNEILFFQQVIEEHLNALS